MERDDDFSGYILYYELDGTFANGWRYEDGELRQTVTETPYRYRGSRPEPIRTRSRDCSEVEIHILTEECTDHFTYVEYDGVTSELNYSHTTCVYFDEVTGSYLVCEDDTGRYGDGGGGYQPPAEPEDPTMGKYASIYSSQSSLSDEEKKLLFGAFDALTTYMNLFDKLLDELRSNKVRPTIKNHVNEWVPAMYTLDRRITFSDKSKILDVYLREELVHAIQHIEYGGMDDKILNYELEAKFFVDILSALSGTLIEYTARDYLLEENLPAYQVWVNGFLERPFLESDMKQLEIYALSAIDPRGRAKHQVGFSYKLIYNYFIKNK